MRKNILKISALALLGAFTLTGCSDDIIAKPADYDNNSPVIEIKDYNGKVYNNNFTDIYDAYRDGSLAQDVLDNLLYQYSISVFGNYNKVTLAKIGDAHNVRVQRRQRQRSSPAHRARQSRDPGHVPVFRGRIPERNVLEHRGVEKTRGKTVPVLRGSRLRDRRARRHDHLPHPR